MLSARVHMRGKVTLVAIAVPRPGLGMLLQTGCRRYCKTSKPYYHGRVWTCNKRGISGLQFYGRMLRPAGMRDGFYRSAPAVHFRSPPPRLSFFGGVEKNGPRCLRHHPGTSAHVYRACGLCYNVFGQIVERLNFYGFHA